MTMTSVSVIMAVMVINIYNRSSKARRAPQWLKVVVLKWICRLLRMSHDMERLASTIRLVRFLVVLNYPVCQLYVLKFVRGIFRVISDI